MKYIAAFVAIFVLLVAAALLFLRDKDYIFRFSEPELHERLNEHLPWSERYLFIFEVTLDNPRIDLIEGSDRVAGGLDATLNIFVNDNPKPLGGAIDLTGGVRYVSDEGAFYLTDPTIEKIAIQGIPDVYANKANEALSKALSAFYRSRPIYRMGGGDPKQLAARLLLKDVVVKDEHLIVTLALDKTRGSAHDADKGEQVQ